MLGINLHVVNVVACKVHEVNPKVEFEILKRFPATSDFIFFIAPSTLSYEDRRLWKNKYAYLVRKSFPPIVGPRRSLLHYMRSVINLERNVTNSRGSPSTGSRS